MFASKDVFFTNRSGGYTIARSVRLRSSASAYLNRTFGTPTNQAKWTLSFWLKRGTLGVTNARITGSSGSSDTADTYIYFDGSDKLNFSGGTTVFRTSAQVFRDTSAWYHIVISVDTTQGTEANKILLYVNGVNYSWGSTSAITTCGYNSVHAVGLGATAIPSGYLDCYLTEINFIDGQALTPSSFGSTNTTTGVWQPIKYTGTYGTNGFYLNFGNNASTTTLGYDTSGNSNNWTTNNISLTAGSTYDSMTDVPTLTSATVANYAVLNPVQSAGNSYTLSNGNLTWSWSGGPGSFWQRASIAVTSGKFYWEVVCTDIGGGPNIVVGVQSPNLSSTSTTSGDISTGYGYCADSTKFTGTTSSAYAATYANGDVVGIALDMDAGNITFYKNNTSQGVAFSGITGSMSPVIMSFTGSSRTTAGSVNFGQRPFTYTPPTGFVALNTYNL